MRTDIAPDNHSRMAEFRLEGTPEGGEQGWRVSGAAESEVSYTEEQNNETRQKKREEPNGPVITTYIKVRSFLGLDSADILTFLTARFSAATSSPRL